MYVAVPSGTMPKNVEMRFVHEHNIDVLDIVHDGEGLKRRAYGGTMVGKIGN